MNSAASAAPSAVVAMHESGAVANWAHTNSGMRVDVMPGARILKMVTRKLIPVIVELMPIRNTATHQRLVPGGPRIEIGGYSVHPASGAPIRNELNKMTPATGKIQNATRLSHGNATSRAPICIGMTKFPNAPVSSWITTNHTIEEPCIE